MANASGPPAPAVFDGPALLARLMGDRRLVNRVLDGFLLDMPRQLDTLAKLLATGNAKAIADQAHRIKGASANVGGEAMRAVALSIEQAAESGALHLVQARLPGLMAQFLRLKDAITCGRDAEMNNRAP